MKKVLLLVEGPTEERFVKLVLSHRWTSLRLVPTIVTTKSTGAATYKGGKVTYDRFRKQLFNLLQDSSVELVTMMMDYEMLPEDFPGREKSKAFHSVAEKARCVENAIKENVGHPKFLPYIAMHEFEALLFSKPEVIAQVLDEKKLKKPLIAEVNGIGPESINDSPATKPSARIKKLCEKHNCSYGKVSDGPIIAERIGLETMLAQCPHFAEWVRKIDEFANAQTPA